MSCSTSPITSLDKMLGNGWIPDVRKGNTLHRISWSHRLTRKPASSQSDSWDSLPMGHAPLFQDSVVVNHLCPIRFIPSDPFSARLPTFHPFPGDSYNVLEPSVAVPTNPTYTNSVRHTNKRNEYCIPGTQPIGAERPERLTIRYHYMFVQL